MQNWTGGNIHPIFFDPEIFFLNLLAIPNIVLQPNFSRIKRSIAIYPDSRLRYIVTLDRRFQGKRLILFKLNLPFFIAYLLLRTSYVIYLKKNSKR